MYIVEVALARPDGTRAHDAKWVVAASADEAGPLALSSAAERWPGHTPIEVVSARVDQSTRADRFLRSWLAARPSEAARTQAEMLDRLLGAETPAPADDDRA